MNQEKFKSKVMDTSSDLTDTESSTQKLGIKENDFYVARIGASAGDFETFQEFFDPMPRSNRIALAVAQHLSPDYKSLEEIHLKLLDEYLPPCIIIDQNDELVQAYGGASKYLKLPGGRTSLNILKLLPKDLSIALETAISRVRKENCTVFCTNIKLGFRIDEETINVKVKPFETQKCGSLVIITLEVSKSSESSMQPIEQNRNITNFIAVKDDIPERKKMIEALKNSEEKYRQLFTNVNGVVFLHSFNATGMPNKFLEVNDFACNLLGYSREELLAMSTFDIIAEECLFEIPKLHQRLLNETYITFEIYYVSKDGKKIPMEVNTHTFILNNERVVLSVAQDISARKKDEKTLKESEERYRQLVEFLPLSIFIYTEECILFTNAMAARLVGLSHPDELVGKSIFDIIHPNFKELVKDRLTKTLQDKSTAPFVEEKLIKLDGTVIDVEKAVTFISYQGIPAVLAVVRDITARKHSEYLQKKLEEDEKLLRETLECEQLKTEFFANLSHELRTPLNVILGTLQLLELYFSQKILGDSEKNTTKKLAILKQNCYRLLRLVNNLIDITKIDAGFFELNLENFNIVNIVEDITLSVAGYIENKSIELLFDTDIEERTIACDPDKIERIMLNLLSNAVKFTKPGGNITVNLHSQPDSIMISVKDTGIGIPPDKLEKVFERFRQVDKSLTRNHEGSGIGLSLVKSLVEMHGGQVCLESNYGSGSEFIIKLPARVLPDSIQDTDNYQHGKEISAQHKKIESIQIEFSDIYN